MNKPQDSSLVLSSYAEKAYLAYAMSVIKGRAIPSLSDGQKPVQRRILFAMNGLGLHADTNPVKSARVVGDVIGKYHPHGEGAAYDAMVRMAQNFTLRYPLVDGIGNYGSRDGDPAAAMRYTEARLTPFAELLLTELEQNTVNFSANYDGRNLEPVELPARLPIVLLNGASGIAVGLATEIPSHNLNEVADALIAFIKTPHLSTQDLLHYIKGPDFASGGHLINSQEELLQLYENGKGSLRVRARYSIEHLARGQWQIVINELPQGVSAQRILAQLEEQSNPSPRPGKKQLSSEQNNQKALLLSMLDKARDESDYKEPTRLVFEPKSSRQQPEEFINFLMAKTDLEINLPAQLVMLDIDGAPQQMSLSEILKQWLIFRLRCLTRRLEHRLNEVEDRLHLLAGRMIVYVHLDEVITIIREADYPKNVLKQRFNLSDIQAEDILNIRLRQLAKLEWLKLESQTAKLNEEAAQLQEYLGSEARKKSLLIKEIKIDKKKFGDARRTKIEPADRAYVSQDTVDEATTVILSYQGWIRRIRGTQSVDKTSFTFKEGDHLLDVLETRSIAAVILFDDHGHSYTISAATVPCTKREGIPLSTLIELPNEHRIIGMLAGQNKEQKVLLASSVGYAFICRIEDLLAHSKNGKKVLTVPPNAIALPPMIIPKNDASLTLLAMSDEPRLLAFPLDEIKMLSKGKGLQVMTLSSTHRLAHLLITDQSHFQLHLREKNGHIRQERYAIADVFASRAKKGKLYQSMSHIVNLT